MKPAPKTAAILTDYQRKRPTLCSFYSVPLLLPFLQAHSVNNAHAVDDQVTPKIGFLQGAPY